jgi:hypothetical protein
MPPFLSSDEIHIRAAHELLRGGTIAQTQKVCGGKLLLRKCAGGARQHYLFPQTPRAHKSHLKSIIRYCAPVLCAIRRRRRLSSRLSLSANFHLKAATSNYGFSGRRNFCNQARAPHVRPPALKPGEGIDWPRESPASLRRCTADE